MNTTSLEKSGNTVSGAAMPGGRLFHAYFSEARYEAMRALRAPAFAIPFLLLPIALYLFFGVYLASSMSQGDSKIAVCMFINFAVFGVMGPGMFGFGVFVAMEREQGLLTLKRALPMPPASYLIAKMFMTMLFAAIIMLTLITAAVTLGHVRLALGQFLCVSAINILGSLPFSAVGLFIGTLASGKAAPAFVNLTYLPTMYLGASSSRCPNPFRRSNSPRPRFIWINWGLR